MFPSVYQDIKQAEYARLVQGPMNIVEYKPKFIELSCYAPQLVEVESYKCNRILNGH